MAENTQAGHAPRARSRSDRAWAWAGALLAAGVSVAVNIAHAGPHAPSSFEVAELVRAGLPVPATVGSWGFAAFAATLPVMVLIAAEQTARRLLGRATLPVMLSIGICAYSLSFWHTVLLLASWGEPWPLRVTGAVAVDGLAVASVIALWYANEPLDVRGAWRTFGELVDTVVTGEYHGPRRADVRASDQEDAGPDAPDPGTRPDAAPVAPARPVAGLDARTDATDQPAPGRPDAQPDADALPGRPDVRTVTLASNQLGTVRLMADVRPEPARTVEHANGSARTSARTALAERPAGRAGWTDAPAPGTPEADVWAAWEAAGRPNDWRTLGALLGVGAEAARKRAGRRAES